jgi:26S proteasome regulatory subunit N5
MTLFISFAYFVSWQTLRAVTDGKIHVELERARLTRQLAKIRESEGKVAEAADLMSEVQVPLFFLFF